MEKFEHIIIEGIVPLISAVLGWLFGRQKNKAELKKMQAEIDNNSIENAEKLLKYYTQIIDDLSQRLEAAQKQIIELENSLCKLKKKYYEKDTN